MKHLALRLLPLGAALASAVAAAQTIDRVKLTDNELSCQQMYAEAQQMEDVIKLAGPGLPPVAPPAVAAAPLAPAMPLSAVQQAVLNHPNNAKLTPEQKATLIAQTGMAEARGNAAVGALYAGAPSAAALHGAVASDPGVQAAIARARASGMSEAQIAATVGAGMQRSGVPVLAGPAYAQAGGLASMFGALAGAGGARAPAAAAPVLAPAPAPGNAGLGAQASARKVHLTTLFLARGCKLADVSK
ncbi:MAG: hypothetical protein Q8K29_14725 [Polaromonas sp.]|nr:hypothetical protein [Polaromonas sp.]